MNDENKDPLKTDVVSENTPRKVKNLFYIINYY